MPKKLCHHHQQQREKYTATNKARNINICLKRYNVILKNHNCAKEKWNDAQRLKTLLRSNVNLLAYSTNSLPSVVATGSLHLANRKMMRYREAQRDTEKYREIKR